MTSNPGKLTGLPVKAYGPFATPAAVPAQEFLASNHLSHAGTWNVLGAAWGTVQKVSNLILNINVYTEDAESGKMKFARSVDIRGNTDESWRRGLDYLLRNYLLREDRTGKTQAVSRVPVACFLFLRAEGRRRCG